MKKFVKPAAFAAAIILLAFSSSAKAAVLPHSKFAAVSPHPFDDKNAFSVEISRVGDDEVISAVIENPGRKNLSITLSGPDGAMIDNFFTGRKLVKMNKRYNFTGADEGLYTLTISDGVRRIKKQVTLQRVTAMPVSQLIVQ